MAISFLRHEVSDLCLAKPALRSLPISATVGHALEALKSSEESFLSVWDCGDHYPSTTFGGGGDGCRCVGKVCMVDVICYLSQDANLLSPNAALKAPVSSIMSDSAGTVMHVEPSCSLLKAIDLMLQGVQNLVLPIQTRQTLISSRRKQHPKPTCTASSTVHTGGQEFCWLTHEDVVRFLLNSIGAFSPLPSLSISSLHLITSDVISAVRYHSPATSAVRLISRSLSQQTSVAVVDVDGTLIGEISPFTLSSCDESAAAAIATLSCGELMSYIDCGGPPEHLVKAVSERLEDRNLHGALEAYVASTSSSTSPIFFSSSSSSDEESTHVSQSQSQRVVRTSGRFSRSNSYSARMVRRSEAIVCRPESSLAAVMIQAIAHRVNYVWVIEDDCSLVGIVTFSGMLQVLREYLETMG